MSLYFLAVLCLEQMTNKEINQLIVKVGKKIGNVVFRAVKVVSSQGLLLNTVCLLNYLKL